MVLLPPQCESFPFSGPGEGVKSVCDITVPPLPFLQSPSQYRVTAFPFRGQGPEFVLNSETFVIFFKVSFSFSYVSVSVCGCVL